MEEKAAETEPLSPKHELPTKPTSGATQTLSGWPPPPASLQKSTIDRVLGILIDAACIASFFLFMALAAVVARVHGRPVDWQQWDMLYAALNAVGFPGSDIMVP